MHSNLAYLLLTINQQQGCESNKLALCSSLTTSALVPNPIRTHTYFWLWTDPHWTHTQRLPKARSPTACTHITTRSQTNNTQMDVQPAHRNRDSFRDSFKGLVALDIIIDLHNGFPNKQHYLSDSNSLGDRAKEGRGSERRHVRTGEGISARIHVMNSHWDRAEEGRRSDRRHSANSLWERVGSCMSVGASIVVADVRVGGVLRGSSDVSQEAQLDMFGTMKVDERQQVWATPRYTLGHYSKWFMPRVKQGGFVLQRATKLAKVWLLRP